jgi:MFS superfamily sulfate permease-like transporter
MKLLYNFFDKLEDKIRGKLSHYPIVYAFVGGVGVVTFWRGVWHTTDFFSEVIFSYQQNITIDIGNLPWWDGPLSILTGSILLLSTGLFVFDFIGTQAIITGLKGEKRLEEKTEEEVRIETNIIGEIKEEVNEISDRLANIEKNIGKK